ncbi:29147_t:CDS:1 [Racocetra persica]|uniref:29147_t:CDS:1 n=1 Tax=Racocetra persica TaxID=160502 RepID=A0ACA9LU14_9GLOM|nr:29147_t:CDS:1 [Racocetra persica]
MDQKHHKREVFICVPEKIIILESIIKRQPTKMNLTSNSYYPYYKFNTNLYHPYCTLCSNLLETSQFNVLKETPSRPQKSEITRKTRSYVTLACTSCRDKKEKCSGEKVCANCKRHNRECIYVQPIKKRGPKPKSAGKPLITPKIANLLNPAV